MKFIKKIFEIPNTPYALPIDWFCEEGEYTWTDWHKEAKQNYPIRYFLTVCLPLWWNTNIYGPIEHFIYYIKSHTYKKQHLLDLRQPKTNTADDYNWGYADQNSKLIFACFNILLDYVQESTKNPYVYGPCDEDIEKLENENDEINLQHLKSLKEIKELKNYWIYTRKNMLREIDKEYDNLSKKGRKRNKDMKIYDKINSLQEEFDRVEEEMLIRLIKIRKSLWV